MGTFTNYNVDLPSSPHVDPDAGTSAADVTDMLLLTDDERTDESLFQDFGG